MSSDEEAFEVEQFLHELEHLERGTSLSRGVLRQAYHRRLREMSEKPEHPLTPFRRRRK